MKKLTTHFAAAAILALSNTAFAENSLQAGSTALNLSVFDGTADNAIFSTALDTSELYIISGKYFLSDTSALTGGIGLGVNGGDANGTNFGVRLGIRKYLSNADFAPFMGGFVGHSSTQDDDVKITKIMGEFGAEYFFNKRLSIEGAARAGYVTYEVGTFDGNYLGTASAGVSFNFYF